MSTSEKDLKEFPFGSWPTGGILTKFQPLFKGEYVMPKIPDRDYEQAESRVHRTVQPVTVRTTIDTRKLEQLMDDPTWKQRFLDEIQRASRNMSERLMLGAFNNGATTMKDPPSGPPPFLPGDQVQLKSGTSAIRVLECEFFWCSSPKTTPHRYAKAKHGRAPRRGWYVRFAYESSLKYTQSEYDGKWREAEDFKLMNRSSLKYAKEDTLGVKPYPIWDEVPYRVIVPDDDSYEVEVDMSHKALYQTKEEPPRFGTFLTKNSTGKIVLEMKGKDGEVEAFDKAEVEEVMPYTVKMKRMAGNGGNDVRHYECTEGDVKQDQILLQISNGQMWRVLELDTKQRQPHRSNNGFIAITGEAIMASGE